MSWRATMPEWQTRTCSDAQARIAPRATSRSGAIASSARNWRCREGELDLIVGSASDLVVVEVKTRRGDGFGHPFEAIDARKRAAAVAARRGMDDREPDTAAGAPAAHRRDRSHRARPGHGDSSSTSSTWRCHDRRAHVGGRAGRCRGRAGRSGGRPVASRRPSSRSSGSPTRRSARQCSGCTTPARTADCRSRAVG